MANATQTVASPLVLEAREGGVAVLTMNRPDKLNALNVELGQALLAALRRVGNDSDVRCVVLTGAGRAFCSGGDLSMIRDARLGNAGQEMAALLKAGKEIVLALCALSKPVVACVNGPAAGAGMNLALACDVRIASVQASFGQNFARVGLVPDFGGTFFLPRLVGPSVAAELFYTGEMISAAEALRLGIVSHVVSPERLAEETRALAMRLASAPPLPARAVKHVLFGSSLAELERALDFENEKQMECFASEDGIEGMNAFFEKRKPVFKGK